MGRRKVHLEREKILATSVSEKGLRLTLLWGPRNPGRSQGFCCLVQCFCCLQCWWPFQAVILLNLYEISPKGLNPLNSSPHPPPPNKKCDSSPSREVGVHSRPWLHLQLTPINSAPNKFISRSGGAPAPTEPPATPMASGVTRVGDTRGGNWGYHSPLYFSRRLFLLITVTPHLFYLSDLDSPPFFVNLPTIIFNIFLQVSPPWRVSAGAIPPCVCVLCVIVSYCMLYHCEHGEVDLMGLKPNPLDLSSFSALTLLVGSFDP